MSAILPHMVCDLSSNLRCRSETCCMRSWLKIQDAKSRQKSPSGHHRTTLSGYIFATKAHIDNRKTLLSSNISSTCPPQYGELRPTSGWDRSGSLGHPGKFQRLWRLGSLLQRRRSTEANQTLHDVYRLLGCYTMYIHFRRFLPRNGILPGATFTLRPNLAFSYFGSITARHSSSGRQPNFAALSIFGRAAITLGIRPHSSYFSGCRRLSNTCTYV